MLGSAAKGVCTPVERPTKNLTEGIKCISQDVWSAWEIRPKPPKYEEKEK